jgi:hypothetical protein
LLAGLADSAVWLLSNAEELEHAILDGRQFRIEHEGGLRALRERHGISGDGGEVGEERAEAEDRQAVMDVPGRGFALRGCGAFGLGEDGGAGGFSRGFALIVESLSMACAKKPGKLPVTAKNHIAQVILALRISKEEECFPMSLTIRVSPAW